MFQGSFKDALRKLKVVSRMPQESFEGVSQKFKGCFKEVSRMFKKSIKGVS